MRFLKGPACLFAESFLNVYNAYQTVFWLTSNEVRSPPPIPPSHVDR